MLRAWLAAVVCSLLLAGCPSPVAGDGGRSGDVNPPAKADAKAPGRTSSAAAQTPQPTGKLLPDAPIPLDKFIGADPPTAEGYLGDPTAKGRTKDSCLRFVPHKVWFRCTHTWQRYADKTGTGEAIEVTYENGKVASIAFVSLNGEGAFNPVGALRKVGLELPDPPELSRPESNVKLWAWWNASARLVIGGRQYRVEVSIVDDAWPSSKVDIILNDPLNADEKAKAFEVKPQRPAG